MQTIRNLFQRAGEANRSPEADNSAVPKPFSPPYATEVSILESGETHQDHVDRYTRAEAEHSVWPVPARVDVKFMHHPFPPMREHAFAYRLIANSPTPCTAHHLMGDAYLRVDLAETPSMTQERFEAACSLGQPRPRHISMEVPGHGEVYYEATDVDQPK